MTVTENQLRYIMTRVPKEFSGKENWLGFKKTPHTPMLFINKITDAGITTNSGFFSWLDCSAETIATIYQRLKLNEKL